MNIYALPNANASVIAVTGTATLLKDLINTAGSTSTVFPNDISAVDLMCEDGDVRIFYDGNTPTASKGILLKQGGYYRFRGIPFHNLRLIRTGSSNVAVSVTIGQTDPTDLENSATQSSVTTATGSVSTVTGNVASGATDSGNPVKVGGKYNATPPTLTDGQRADAQLDFNGNWKETLATLLAGEDLTNNLIAMLSKPIVSATYSPSLYTDLAAQVTKANIKATPANVLSAYVTNTNAAVRYFQLHNKASAPAGGDVPIYSIPIPAGSATVPGVLNLNDTFFTKAGKFFATGLGCAISTTLGTFTDSATNTEHITTVHYV